MSLSVTFVACSNRGDTVAILGDSITALDQADLEDQLGDDFELVVSGNFGFTVNDVVPEAEALAERSYDQVIVNIGTNDVIFDDPLEESVAALDRIISLFGSARCIHVVSINEHMVDQKTGEPSGDRAREFNAALEGFVADDDDLSLVDWAAATSDTLNDEEPRFSTLTEDSVHPTPEGNAALNELYADALRGC